MANILNIENLTKSYGYRLLFADLTLGIDRGDKIGIVARNGTGKSTLLSILAGIEDYDSGSITYRNDIRIGYLPQQPFFEAGRTILQEALANDNDPSAAALAAYHTALASGSHDEIEQASRCLDELSAWDYEDRLKQTLTMLGLSDFDTPTDTLSGGQRKRLALARLVMSQPDILLLDEPTNHLDIATIEWLENYLKRSRATLLMVTHDRYFLDRVCSRIIEIDDKSAYIVDGNFDMYLRRRAERIEAANAELARARNTLRREQEWMSRQPQARGGKAKYRIDNFYDLRDKASQRRNDDNIRLETTSSRIGSKIFEAEGVCKRFGDKVILDDFTYTFARGERLGIVGPNGVGKSTFIKLLQGLIPLDKGRWDLGTTVRPGYYSQEELDFNPDAKVVDAITAMAEEIELRDGVKLSPMQYLQRFLFSPADQQKYIRTLSGGERCRLQLAAVLMRRPNFLILDEPTNDLDIITLGILEEYIADFEGCVIVISHDRYFLDNIVDHIFVMEGNGVIKDFPGNYSDYRAWLDSHSQNSSPDTPKAQPAKAPEKSQRNNNRMTYRERQEFDSLTTEIDELSAEKSAIEALFSSGQCTDAEEFKRRTMRYNEIKELLDIKEMRWLELSEKK